MKYLFLSFVFFISHQAFSDINQELIQAVKVGNIELTKDLLKKGADVNTNYQGRTPVYYAVEKNNLDIAKLLLVEYKANPNIQIKSGNTPLHQAASSGKVKMAKLLLENRADPTIENSANLTPKDYAKNSPAESLFKLSAVGKIKQTCRKAFFQPLSFLKRLLK